MRGVRVVKCVTCSGEKRTWGGSWSIDYVLSLNDWTSL